MIELLGAFLYRWRGMAHPYKKYFPRPFNQAAFAFPFAVAAFLYYDGFEFQGWAWAIAGVVWVLTTLGALTGHGRGMDLGETDKGEPETLEFLIAWLKPKVSLYWYDAALLAVTGLAITLPAGIATLNPILALSGILKAPAYMIGKFCFTKEHVEAGELLTGAVLWSMVFYWGI